MDVHDEITDDLRGTSPSLCPGDDEEDQGGPGGGDGERGGGRRGRRWGTRGQG